MKLRDILKDETCWTKKYAARDKNGIPVEPSDENAVCFCLYGGIAAIYDLWSKDADIIINKLYEAKNELFPAWKYSLLAEFNDAPETTFEDICKVIEKAGV